MTEKLEHNVLIIPDVHGRIFWKRPVEHFRSQIEAGEMEVVFLGDYLDPYPFEIDEELAYSVVSSMKQLRDEIIPFAREKKNVHLLLGNHDMHYFNDDYSSLIFKCRYSRYHSKSIKKVFKENASLFRLAWDCFIGDDMLVLFTHAGVLKSWVDCVFRGNKIRRPNADFLNNILDNGKEDILKLACPGPYRGGWGRIPGSPIWADAYEHVYGWKNEECPDRKFQEVYKDKIYQVFGHTLSYPPTDFYDEMKSFNQYEINEHWAMLDARQCFIMDLEGKIRAFSEYEQDGRIAEETSAGPDGKR